MHKQLWTTLVLLILFHSAQGFAQDENQPKRKRTTTPSTTSDFIRIKRSEDGKPLVLETAVTSYSAGKKGAQVDLIGAVHVGEATYYQQLNQLFDKYDVLLYELVAPEGTVIDAKAAKQSSNPVSFLQNSMKEFLGLHSQLETVDYSKKHFVRADMTPEQIALKMSERGDTALTIALSTFADVLRQQNMASQKHSLTSSPSLKDTDLMELLGDPLKAKVMLAEQFVSTGSLDQALGSSLNQLLVVDRNA